MVKSVEDDLNELQGQFDAKQVQIKNLTTDSSGLKQRIDELTKKVNDVKQVSGPYEQLLKNIEVEKNAIAAIARKKEAIVDKELNDNAKESINKKIEEVDDAIKDLESEEQTLLDNIVDINKKITEAKEDVEKKGIAYDSIKNYQKTVAEDLKLLKDLKTDLQKEESTEVLYFLLKELGNIKNTNHDTGETLKSNLYTAQGELENAKKLLEQREGELNTAKKNLDEKKKEKDAKIKSRKSDITNKIK